MDELMTEVIVEQPFASPGSTRKYSSGDPSTIGVTLPWSSPECSEYIYF